MRNCVDVDNRLPVIDTYWVMQIVDVAHKQHFPVR